MNEGRDDGRLIRKQPLIAEYSPPSNLTSKRKGKRKKLIAQRYRMHIENGCSQARDRAIMVPRNFDFTRHRGMLKLASCFPAGMLRRDC